MGFVVLLDWIFEGLMVGVFDIFLFACKLFDKMSMWVSVSLYLVKLKMGKWKITLLNIFVYV
jgi:hypothetical protein